MNIRLAEINVSFGFIFNNACVCSSITTCNPNNRLNLYQEVLYLHVILNLVVLTHFSLIYVRIHDTWGSCSQKFSMTAGRRCRLCTARAVALASWTTSRAACRMPGARTTRRASTPTAPASTSGTPWTASSRAARPRQTHSGTSQSTHNTFTGL